MKEKLIRLRDTIDAKTLRERVMLFAAVAGLIVFIVYTSLLSPMFAKQTQLRTQINQQNNNLVGIDAEIKATILAFQRDPDQEARARLTSIKGETAVLRSDIQNMQANLVPPERMAPLLENLLQGNRRLRMQSLSSMPAVSMRGPAAAPSDALAAQAGDAIYRHGVQLTVTGNYLDMLEYMRALEAMPTRLYWGKAALQVEDYPTSRLTLTLYTLSLDKKWMTL